MIISDRKKRLAGATPAFEAVIETAQDYYPFGSLMPGRKYNAGEYRYGFNGKEKDDEVTGVTGATYDYGFRIYDSRISRFLSVDPLTKSYPMLTPYQFVSNTPIQAIDLDGMEALNCTSILYLSTNHVGGIGYVVKTEIKIGNAYDMIGTTQFIALILMNPSNQDLEDGTNNPQFLLGGEVSALNFGVDIVGKPTFEKAYQTVAFSLSTVDVKWGIGGSASIGENNSFGLSIGLGIGGHFETGNNSTIVQSISISNQERKNTTFGSIWLLGPQTSERDENGNITGYSSKLFEVTLSGNPKVNFTGINVYSEATTMKDENGNEMKTTTGSWKSKEYENEENAKYNKE
jgi:RHS repeat-associated protein